MNQTPPLIAPILATPFGVMPLPQAAAVNPALRDVATRRAIPSPGSLYQRSQDDLFEWQEPGVQELREAMLDGVYAIVAAVNEVSEAQLRSWTIETRAWINVLHPNGNLPAASYPLSAWCALYCVAAPAPSDTRLDSGMLRLYETRFGTMFQDASNASLRFPFKAAHYSWRPVPGEMAVFPASLLHEITPLRATGALMWVSARIRFVAPGQQGIGRW